MKHLLSQSTWAEKRLQRALFQLNQQLGSILNFSLLQIPFTWKEIALQLPCLIFRYFFAWIPWDCFSWACWWERAAHNSSLARAGVLYACPLPLAIPLPRAAAEFGYACKDSHTCHGYFRFYFPSSFFFFLIPLDFSFFSKSDFWKSLNGAVRPRPFLKQRLIFTLGPVNWYYFASVSSIFSENQSFRSLSLGWR